MTEKLPKGIWYEVDKQRYRVRRYHNKVPYLKGYYRTFPEAQRALAELTEYLKTIPKIPKRRRGKPGKAPVHATSLAGTIGAIRARQNFDPNILRRKKN